MPAEGHDSEDDPSPEILPCPEEGTFYRNVKEEMHDLVKRAVYRTPFVPANRERQRASVSSNDSFCVPSKPAMIQPIVGVLLRHPFLSHILCKHERYH